MSCYAVDAEIIRCQELPFWCRLVGLAFASHANRPDEAVYPSNGTIAHRLGCSVRHVRQAVTRLEAAGLMRTRWRKGGRGKTTRWQFCTGKADQSFPRIIQSSYSVVQKDYSALQPRLTLGRIEGTTPKPKATPWRRLVGVVWACRGLPHLERWSEAKARCHEQGLPYWQRSKRGGTLLDAAFRMLEYRQ